MFYNAVMKSIDMFANSTFVDDKITITLDGNVCDYLFFLNHPDGSTVFTKTTRLWNNITIYKNDKNSNDNKVNPEFLKKLKETTICYFKSIAVNWIVLRETDTDTKIHNPSVQPKKLMNHFTIMPVFNCYGLKDKLIFEILDNKHYYSAQWKNILKFASALRWESIQTQDTRSMNLLILAKNNITYNENCIPEEIILKIVDIMSYLYAPNPLNEAKINDVL